MNYYDEESLCLCGLEDFLLVLKGYRLLLHNNIYPNNVVLQVGSKRVAPMGLDK